jgi:nucleotide-binding universal stress UspA family protein
MKLRTLVIPLDGSTLAEGALARAAELAVDANARVIVVRATQASSFSGADPVEAQVKVVQEAEAYLAGVATYLRTLGVKDVRAAVWYGAAAPAIIEATALNHADLIVMMTHGRSGLGRLVMGSVAESVLRGTTTPILLLRDTQAPVEAPVGVAAAAPSCST